MPRSTAKKRILMYTLLPFIFLMELFTKSRSNANPKPTMKKIIRKNLTSSFKMIPFVIINKETAREISINTMDVFLIVINLTLYDKHSTLC